MSDLFGNSAVVKVLDFVLEDWEIDFSASDIARETGLTWKTVAEIMPLLKTSGLVVETREISRAKLYKIVTTSPLFKSLKKLDLRISSVVADKIVSGQATPVQNIMGV